MNTVAVCCCSQLRTLWHWTTHLQPASLQAQLCTLALLFSAQPLHDLCQQLPDVYSDPSDGAGAGVNVSTREVRGTGVAAVGEMGPPCGEVGLREV